MIEMNKIKIILIAMLSFSGMTQAAVVYFWGNASGNWSTPATWAGGTTLPSPTSVNQDIAITIGNVTIDVTTDGQGAIDLMMYHTGYSTINVAAGKSWQITSIAQVGCGNDTDVYVCTGVVNVYGTAYFGQLNVGNSLKDTGIVNVYDGGSVVVGTRGLKVGFSGATVAGTINLIGGSMTINDGDGILAINEKGRINIESGFLKVFGDKRTQLQGYIDAGKITGYYSAGTVNAPVLDGSYTVVTAEIAVAETNCNSPSDFNHDCYVDFKDFAIFAQEWLTCYNPQDPMCI